MGGRHKPTRPQGPIPDVVLAAYGFGDRPAEVPTVEPMTSGLINQTFLVDSYLVVQRLHSAFGPEVNDDLEAITERLADRGMQTPRLVTTDNNAKYVMQDGQVWRAISYIHGVTVSQVESLAQAQSAGELIGGFHRALDGFDYEYRSVRSHVHDTTAHLGRLAQVADETPKDQLERDAAVVSWNILQRANHLSDFTGLPTRHCHGDLKISNVLFYIEDPDRARCLIDLDTLGALPIAYELGDALRSWCNRSGEDVERPNFDLDVLEAMLSGYARGAKGLLEPAEWESIVAGVETVCIELAARFCYDVFADDYFGWDSSRFPSRRHHNLLRARGQLALAEAVHTVRAQAQARVGAIAGPG